MKGFVTPGSVQYTPITRAAIGVVATSALQPRRLNITIQSAQPEWIHPDTEKVALGVGSKKMTASFHPKFRVMSARERKMLDMAGHSGSVEQWNTGSDELASEQDAASVAPSSAGRVKSDLIASTVKWSTPTVRPAVPLTQEPVNAKRISSPLIAATRSWSDPSRSSDEPPQDVPSYVRRQTNDLIPATMPWVSPYTSPALRADAEVQVQDFRRKKGITEENFPQSGSIFDKDVCSSHRSPITSCVAPLASAEKRTSTVSSFVVKNVETNGHEAETVKTILCQAGLHVVVAKAGIDIISNRFDGSVKVSIRHDSDISAVLQKTGLHVLPSVS